MANNILLFPTVNEEHLKKLRFQKSKYTFFYTDKDDEKHELNEEPVEAFSSVYCIKDEKGEWNQDKNNLGFHRKYLLRTFQHLFGEEGVVCKNAELGMAIIWTSSDSKQRGVIPIGTFKVDDKLMEVEVEEVFERAQLRGQIDFTTIIYLATSGVPNENELHLANTSGYVLGKLETFIVKLDGKGSVFPIFEVAELGQPLWYVKCDWIDPTIDLFSDCISINLNTAHKNYKYIDRKHNSFNGQLLVEIMTGAIVVIIEKVRLQVDYWEQIMNNDSLEDGSIGQAIYYFSETLEWDLSSPEMVSLCARKFFEQRM